MDFQIPTYLAVALVMVSFPTVTGVIKWSRARARYDTLARAIILDILLKKKPRLSELRQQVNGELLGTKLLTEFEVRVLSTRLVSTLQRLESEGHIHSYLTIEYVWDMKNVARWEKHTEIMLTASGQTHAKEYVNRRV